MEQEEIKKKITAFLEKGEIGVISTIGTAKNAPESAAVAFAFTENLELVFGTSNKSRKYKNIQVNPNVSFVVGWDFVSGTMQYEGIAKELSGEEAEKGMNLLIARNEEHKKFAQHEDQRYFMITPKWIRLLDMNSHPPQTHEVNL